MECWENKFGAKNYPVGPIGCLSRRRETRFSDWKILGICSTTVNMVCQQYWAVIFPVANPCVLWLERRFTRVKGYFRTPTPGPTVHPETPRSGCKWREILAPKWCMAGKAARVFPGIKLIAIVFSVILVSPFKQVTKVRLLIKEIFFSNNTWLFWSNNAGRRSWDKLCYSCH